jgi:hypothetical protein|tara:strand:- start:457 stop:1008 length:552 start_codon:yes stop_codon:yes gene_type:complete
MTTPNVEITVHNTFNHQKWVIETQLPDWKDTLKYWDQATDTTNIEETASNVATQTYFMPAEGKALAEHLRSYINGLLTDLNSPIRAGAAKIAWTLEYKPGGWQAIHNHAEQYKAISCVLCLEGEEESGTYYAMLPEPDGTQEIVVINQVPGTLIVSEGDVWHGSYPCTVGKKVYVFDFIQEIL